MTDGKDVNRIVKRHLQRLQEDIAEKKQEAREIYQRSKMPVPKWCKDE